MIKSINNVFLIINYDYIIIIIILRLLFIKYLPIIQIIILLNYFLFIIIYQKLFPFIILINI